MSINIGGHKVSLIVNGHNIFLIVAVTFLCSFIMSFLVKKIAKHIGAMDEPNYRKVHKEPVPRVGGLAIFSGFILGYMLYGEITTQMISILIGSIIIIITGLVDDINPVPAKIKFFFQLLAACVVVFYGRLFFNDITLFGLIFKFPTIVNQILSVIFIAGIINAINLVDGLNGLSSGICNIYFLTIAIIAFVLSRLNGLDVMLSLIMLGSTLGFWVHNFPKGKIFMGDSGSMFLGFMIATIALLGYKVATITSIITPIIILFIPLIDTVFAILRRILKHESIGSPDKDHLHHQLLKMTSSPVKTVLLIYVMNIAFAAVSIFFVLGNNKIALVIYVALMIIFGVLILKTDILFKHKH